MTKTLFAQRIRTTYLTKIEKSSKIVQEKKSLISAFAWFFTATAKA